MKLKYLHEDATYVTPHIVLDVPNIRQSTPHDCAIAITQMLLFYYGIDKREDELRELIPVNDDGTDIDNICTALDMFGVPNVRDDSITIHKIQQELQESHPVVLLVRADAGQNHFVIVVGYDNRGFILNDPSDFERKYVAGDELSSMGLGGHTDMGMLGIICRGQPVFNSRRLKLA